MAEICIIESDKIVNGSNLMKGNTDLIEWNSDLSKLENGQYMFQGCSNLETFTSNLSSLTDGTSMFNYCTNLLVFTSDLHNLTVGDSMFYNCWNLTTFDSDLSSLTSADGMFYYCYNLITFTSDLSSLTNGYCMFSDCSLETFTSDLSSLTNGEGMFGGCNLGPPSVKNIALTINKNVTDNPSIFLGIADSITSDEEVMKDIGLIKHKGWDVCVNSDNSSSVYILPKYVGCTTIDEVEAKDANYLSNDIVSGVWSEHLPDLSNGSAFFQYHGTLTSFNADLSSLTDGTDMFYGCIKLATFTSNLSSLRHGYRMFYNCQKLATFNSKLSSLWNGYQMFLGCDTLTTFTSDMPILENGEGMFNHADNLTTFNSLMPSLTNGDMMFVTCTKLTSFYSDLSSLTSGFQMFTECKLDTASVQNIADTINTYSGKIYIGIGNTTPNEQETTAFNTMVSKGWIVYVNGSKYIQKPSAGSNPINIELDETETPIPFYAKPVPATEETASYIDSEGNYYNILGGQFIYGDDLSTYGMFTCEEDAAANMRLTKIEK